MLERLCDDAGIQIELEEKMDAAGTALQEEIDKLDADVSADNEAVVKGGEAVAAAGVKFAELKALVEKQAAGALSDEEAQKLSALAGEVDAHLGTANTELAAHVAQLGEETAAA